MLFDASTTYAAGEPHGDVGYSAYMDVDRYNLATAVRSPNVWIGLIGIAVVAYLVHKHGGKR